MTEISDPTERLKCEIDNLFKIIFPEYKLKKRYDEAEEKRIRELLGEIRSLTGQAKQYKGENSKQNLNTSLINVDSMRVNIADQKPVPKILEEVLDVLADVAMSINWILYPNYSRIADPSGKNNSDQNKVADQSPSNPSLNKVSDHDTKKNSDAYLLTTLFLTFQQGSNEDKRKFIQELKEKKLDRKYFELFFEVYVDEKDPEIKNEISDLIKTKFLPTTIINYSRKAIENKNIEEIAELIPKIDKSLEKLEAMRDREENPQIRDGFGKIIEIIRKEIEDSSKNMYENIDALKVKKGPPPPPKDDEIEVQDRVIDASDSEREVYQHPDDREIHLNDSDIRATDVSSPEEVNQPATENYEIPLSERDVRVIDASGQEKEVNQPTTEDTIEDREIPLSDSDIGVIDASEQENEVHQTPTENRKIPLSDREVRVVDTSGKENEVHQTAKKEVIEAQDGDAQGEIYIVESSENLPGHVKEIAVEVLQGKEPPTSKQPTSESKPAKDLSAYYGKDQSIDEKKISKKIPKVMDYIHMRLKGGEVINSLEPAYTAYTQLMSTVYDTCFINGRADENESMKLTDAIAREILNGKYVKVDDIVNIAIKNKVYFISPAYIKLNRYALDKSLLDLNYALSEHKSKTKIWIKRIGIAMAIFIAAVAIKYGAQHVDTKNVEDNVKEVYNVSKNVIDYTVDGIKSIEKKIGRVKQKTKDKLNNSVLKH